MKVEMQVNERYQPMSGLIENLPKTFESLPDIIQNVRNDIRLGKFHNQKVVIKSFEGMYLPNQIAYSSFRKSKAQRSYETSQLILKKGFTVPTPVAYVDCYRLGLLTQSYFISAYQDHIPLKKMIANEDLRAQMLPSLGEFTYNLHRSGVLHDDFSVGNILCVPEGDQFKFSLVDLNRVRFRKVTYDEGLKTFSKLDVDQSNMSLILQRYAQLWNADPAEALNRVLEIRSRRQKIVARRNWLKSIVFPWRARKYAVGYH